MARHNDIVQEPRKAAIFAFVLEILQHKGAGPSISKSSKFCSENAKRTHFFFADPANLQLDTPLSKKCAFKSIRMYLNASVITNRQGKFAQEYFEINIQISTTSPYLNIWIYTNDILLGFSVV